MKIRYYVLLIGLVVLNPSQAGTIEWALKDLEALQHAADSAFAQQDYKAARRHYYQLASLGNKFAQYRLSIIYMNGYAVRQSLPTAFAWAHVAAELGQPQLVAHAEGVWSQVPGDQRVAAQQKADKFMEKYNDRNIARVLWQKARQKNLESIGHGTMPDALVSIQAPCEDASAQANASSGAASAGANPTASTSSYSKNNSGCAGFSSRREDPAMTLQRIEMIERVMRTKYEGGLVELGDFEVLEEPADSTPPADDEAPQPGTPEPPQQP